MPGRNGGTLLVGPTNKGGPGRPPDAFKAMMAQAADRAVQALLASAILEDVDHPLYLDAAKWCADRGYGKPEATQTVKGSVTEPLTIRVVHE